MMNNNVMWDSLSEHLHFYALCVFHVLMNTFSLLVHNCNWSQHRKQPTLGISQTGSTYSVNFPDLWVFQVCFSLWSDILNLFRGFFHISYFETYVYVRDGDRPELSALVTGTLRKSQISIVSSWELLTIWNSSNCNLNTRPECSCIENEENKQKTFFL